MTSEQVRRFIAETDRATAMLLLQEIANQFGIYATGNEIRSELHRIDRDEIILDEALDIVLTLNKETNGI